MMKFAMALIVLLCILIMPLSLAMSETDKVVLKVTMNSILDKTDDFKYVKSEVGQDNSLNVWYVPEKTDQESVLTDIAYILGAYFGATKSHPDLADLNIFAGTQEYTNGKMYCQRDWMDATKKDSNGNMDETDAGLLVFKVLGTWHRTS